MDGTSALAVGRSCSQKNRVVRVCAAARSVPCASNAERAIMIGDSETDILTAKAARIPVVAVDFGYSQEPVANFAPDIVISHFNELHGAVTKLARAKV